MDNTTSKRAPNLWQRVKTFFQSDRADSVLITTVIGIPALLLVGGFAMDTSKNAMVSSSHHSQAQVSAQSAVREINARGSLGVQSIVSFHESLEREFDVNLENISPQQNTCAVFEPLMGDGGDEVFPRYSLHFIAENNYEYDIDDPDHQTVKSGTFTYTAGENFDDKLSDFVQDGGLDNNQVYKVIAADVHTSSQNIMMGMFNMPCQAYHSHVEAGAFNEL